MDQKFEARILVVDIVPLHKELLGSIYTDRYSFEATHLFPIGHFNLLVQRRVGERGQRSVPWELKPY